MERIRFVADGPAVVLVAETKETGSAGLSAAAPPRIEVIKRSAGEEEIERWGTVALLDEPAMAQSVARCLNAALRLDRDDILAAARALEILVDQQLAKIGVEDPAALMSEAIRYVFRQERWVFRTRQETRPDGVRLLLDNPAGDPVPLSVHVSTRGRTPSFWVMQDSRIIQGSHAYKIPIQAAAALQQAVQDYLNTHDTGTIRPFG